MTQSDFSESIKSGNSVLGNYLAGLNGAKASLGGYIAKLVGAKAATIGLKIATSALNAAISIVASVALQKLFALIGEIVVTSEEAIEKAKELQESYDNATETFTSNIKSLHEMRDEFEKLSEGVDDNGKNISLTAEEYKDYLELINDIVEISPSVCAGYDSEGKALLDYKKVLDQAIISQEDYLENQRNIYLSGGEDIFKGATSSFEDAKDNLGDLGNKLANEATSGILELFFSPDESQLKLDAFWDAIDFAGIEWQLGIDTWDTSLDKVLAIYENRDKIIQSMKNSGAYDESEILTIDNTIRGFAADYSKIQSAKKSVVDYIAEWSKDQSWYLEIPEESLEGYISGLYSIVDLSSSYQEQMLAVTAYGKEFIDTLDDISLQAKEAEEAVGSLLNSNTSPEIDAVISKYQQAVDLIHKATSEQDSTNAVSLETYNALIKINEDYSDLFEFTANGIQLQTDALVENIDALEQTTAAELAATGATGTEIASIFAATSALKKYGATATASLDDISDLVDMQKELEEGTEYSTVQMLDLIEQYPSLAGSIIETANGYKIETEAVKDLVDEKVKLYKQNKLLETQSSKDALISQSGRSVVAKNVEKIFDQYYSDNGKHIGSLEDYISKRSDMFSGSSIETAFKGEEVAYVEELIKFYAADNLLTGILNNETKAGITPSSSSSDAETEFEKAYNLHQHYLAMDQESVEDYVDWLSLAYKQAVADGSLSLEDAYQYEEEVYEKRKELFADYISDTEHQISILENDPITDNSDKITALYQELQSKVHAQAEKYRAMGLDENDEVIQELQNQWWQYADAISQIREEAFSKNIDDLNYGIETLKLNDGDSSEILSTYDNILKAIRYEIEYYTSLGYGESSEVIRDLTGQLNDTKEEIIGYINEVVEEANNILDGFEEAYSTITDAAKEYASTGALSADSLQSILELSPKYLSFLNDENGQLVLNKQALQNIIAAKTEEMAVENALAYSRQILRAAQENDINSLITLTDVTKAGSNATWDMAYATLSLAKAIGTANGMDSGYFDSAADYVSKMQSLSRTAVSTISTYFSALEEGYVSHADGLQTILDLTQDMIKWENEQLIDALEKEKEDYADIIDQKKELIQLAKEQDDREKSVAENLEKMAKLQGQIAQLSLDDSREAQAQRRSLEEELADLQKELADEQSDYSFEVQEEALDKELEAFEKSKDDEIEALEDTLSSAEKLYQAAIDRIGNGWDELYEDLREEQTTPYVQKCA